MRTLASLHHRHSDFLMAMPLKSHIQHNRLQSGIKAGLRQKGFTLIELMVTVAIISILAAIAYPSYLQYVIKSKRNAAQAFMLDISNIEKQYLLDVRAYTATLSDLGVTLPPEIAPNYTIVVAVGTAPPSFTITATPVTGTSQASDGNLTLDATGTKLPIGKW